MTAGKIGGTAAVEPDKGMAWEMPRWGGKKEAREGINGGGGNVVV